MPPRAPIRSNTCNETATPYAERIEERTDMSAVTQLTSETGADLSERDQRILQYQGLVRYVVRRLPIAPPPGLDYEDLVSFGTIGLMQALDRFDPTREVKFESYAILRIRGAIL